MLAAGQVGSVCSARRKRRGHGHRRTANCRVCAEQRRLPPAVCRLDGDGVALPHADALLLARCLASTTANVNLTVEAKNMTGVVSSATIQRSVEVMRSGLYVDVDRDNVVNN